MLQLCWAAAGIASFSAACSFDCTTITWCTILKFLFYFHSFPTEGSLLYAASTKHFKEAMHSGANEPNLNHHTPPAAASENLPPMGHFCFSAFIFASNSRQGARTQLLIRKQQWADRNHFAKTNNLINEGKPLISSTQNS